MTDSCDRASDSPELQRDSTEQACEALLGEFLQRRESSSPATRKMLSEPLCRALEISQALRAQMAGAKIDGRAQVAQLLSATLEAIDELPRNKRWTEHDRTLVCNLIDDYNRGDAQVIAAINSSLGLTETSKTNGKVQEAQSLPHLERMIQAPEQRANLVASLVERGDLREGNNERQLDTAGDIVLFGALLRVRGATPHENGLTQDIQEGGDSASHPELSESERRANALAAIDNILPENLRPLVRRMVTTAEGLIIAQRIVVIPPEILKKSRLATQLPSVRPLKTILQDGEFLDALNAAEESVLDYKTSLMTPIPTSGKVFSTPEQKLLLKMAQFQNYLMRAEGGQRLTPQQLSERVLTYFDGAGAARQTLPPGGSVRRDRVLHLVVGLPGAGKSSTLVNPLQQQFGARLIDPDLVKPGLPGYRNGLGNSLVRDMAARVAAQLFTESLSRGENVVYPTLGRYPKFMHRLISEARSQGYRVAIHLADISPAESARRVYERGMRQPTATRHGAETVRQVMPPELSLVEIGHRPAALFEVLCSTPGIVDAWSRIDTTGAKPRVTSEFNMESMRMHVLDHNAAVSRPAARCFESPTGARDLVKARGRLGAMVMLTGAVIRFLPAPVDVDLNLAPQATWRGR